MVHSDAEAIHTPFLISRQKAANESAMVKARGFAGSDRACAGVEPAPYTVKMYCIVFAARAFGGASGRLRTCMARFKVIEILAGSKRLKFTR